MTAALLIIRSFFRFSVNAFNERSGTARPLEERLQEELNMVRIEPLDLPHLPQALALANSHLGTLVPGWSLTPDYFRERLKSNPEEYVVDPWVVERKSFVGISRDRVCAAAHLLRYGEDTRWKGVGEIAWILFWPEEREAGAAVLSECRRQMEVWKVSEEQISGSLPVPVCPGIPDVWPHISGLVEEFGYSSSEEVDESVYGGTLTGISPPGQPPVDGATIHREVGNLSTRFVARVDGSDLGRCECISDLTAGGQLPALAGWAELAEMETSESMRNRGVGSWVLRHAVEWLRLARCDRIVISVAREHEEAGAGRFYSRFGWMPLVRQKHWRRRGCVAD